MCAVSVVIAEALERVESTENVLDMGRDEGVGLSAEIIGTCGVLGRARAGRRVGWPGNKKHIRHARRCCRADAYQCGAVPVVAEAHPCPALAAQFRGAILRVY